MDWFRWWHGTLTDPKFKSIARKSGQPFTVVITMWVALLEYASNVTHGDARVTRGDVTNFACDDYDVLLEVEDGVCSKILEAFAAKGMIVDNSVTQWDRRQSKRDDSSAERTRAYRERKNNETFELIGDADVTLGDDEERDVTPRGDEIREESNSSTDVEVALGDAEARSKNRIPNCPHQKLIELYAEHLPMLPYPVSWEGERQGAMRARWRWVLTAKKRDGSRHATDEASAVAWFARFFTYAAKSDFLTGRNGKWENCDLGWLVKAENFVKVLQGNYENGKNERP